MNVKEKIQRNNIKKEKRNSDSYKWLKAYKKVVTSIILFPFAAYDVCSDRYRKYKDKHFVENKETTKKYIDKVIPKLVDKFAEYPDCFVIGLSSFYDYQDFSVDDFTKKRYVGKKTAEYFSRLDYERRKEMLLDYEIDGYEKYIADNWIKWEHVIKYFDWEHNYDNDHQKAIIFYLSEKYVPEKGKLE